MRKLNNLQRSQVVSLEFTPFQTRYSPMYVFNYISEKFIDIVTSIRKVSLRNYTNESTLKILLAT